MSSVECLREFVSERLTAAAEEIFGVFKRTIVEYEEEIDRQRRLLDILWKPKISVQKIEFPQQQVCKEEEEVLSEQQPCNQERNSSLDQEDPEPPQIKEEQEELWNSQGVEECLGFKQETETFMFTPVNRDSDHSEDRVFNTSVPEPNSESFHLSSHGAQMEDQKGDEHEDSGSTRDGGSKQSDPRTLLSTHLNRQCNSHAGQTSFTCHTCGKDFKFKSICQRHMRIHTGVKPYVCPICGRDFIQNSDLKIHTRRAHTGEKPYCCKTCGKCFSASNELKVHMRSHSEERPFSCVQCGKSFKCQSYLSMHVRRTHTDTFHVDDSV